MADRGPLVDDEQLRPVRPHHRLHLLQHCPGSSGGLEVGASHRLAEVVQLLKRAETVRQAEIAPVGEHDEGADSHEREHCPGVPPGRVEDDQGEGDARYEHQRDGGELEPVLALLGVSIEANDDGDRQVAVDEGRAERQGSRRPTDGKDRDARSTGDDELSEELPVHDDRDHT